MILSFHPCFTAEYQIILGDRSLNSEDLLLINKAKVIILPQSCPYDLYQACKTSSAYLFPNYEVRFRFPGKIGQAILFEKAGLPYPETTQWDSVEEFRNAMDRYSSYPHGVPFILKTDDSHEGEGIYIIEDSESLELSLKSLSNLERSGSRRFISQELIPSGGNTLRAVIMGHKIITYWKRSQGDGEVIITVSRGAKIDSGWRKDLQKKGRIQARKLSSTTGINLAAIDLVFPIGHHTDPGPLLLEINYYFGRRGLGGSLTYYRLLFETIKDWLRDNDLDSRSIKLV
ncbi:RimK family alpha-L-glutamate ligase [Thermodesulfobacteriota bacterium]